MRIAQIAGVIERVPPKKYGGVERVVYHLTEELVKRGHEVTLFASGDSQTSAKLVSITSKCLKEMNFQDPYGGNVLTQLNIGNAYRMQNRFDIIHDHNGVLSLPAANIAKKPVVMTYHGPLNKEICQIYNTLRSPHIVTISKSQARNILIGMNYAGTVYNGLPLETYPFSDIHHGYLLFVGRITLEKGVHFAIEAAEQLGLPLIIAAKLETAFKPDTQYFKEYVEPKLSEKIRWIGEVDEIERNELMRHALAFLYPVTWSEPFGLTMIESMACGAPVIGFNNGSVPELVKEGQTGFVVTNTDQMIEAIKHIDTIDRADCRSYAVEHFSVTKMAEQYELIYKRLLAKQQPTAVFYPRPFLHDKLGSP